MMALVLAAALAASPAQVVVDALGAAAAANAARPAAARIAGDPLGDTYVRTACGAQAEPLPAMLGLCYALAPRLIERQPLLGAAVEGLTRPAIPLDRAAAPRLRRSTDALLHFACSATLALASNAQAATWIGVQKELADADAREKGAGSGFNFAEVAVDIAGVEFARSLQQPGGMARCARSFEGVIQVPPLTDLASRLRRSELEQKWGPVDGPRFKAETERITTLVREWQARRR